MRRDVAADTLRDVVFDKSRVFDKSPGAGPEGEAIRTQACERSDPTSGDGGAGRLTHGSARVPARPREQAGTRARPCATARPARRRARGARTRLGW